MKRCAACMLDALSRSLKFNGTVDFRWVATDAHLERTVSGMTASSKLMSAGGAYGHAQICGYLRCVWKSFAGGRRLGTNSAQLC